MQTSKPKSFLDETFQVTLTRFELMKIREWNSQRMSISAHALENILMKPCKRSRWQVEYDFHAALCDHLHGIDLDEEEKIKAHNESVRAQMELMEYAMADLSEKYKEIKRQLL